MGIKVWTFSCSGTGLTKEGSKWPTTKKVQKLALGELSIYLYLYIYIIYISLRIRGMSLGRVGMCWGHRKTIISLKVPIPMKSQRILPRLQLRMASPSPHHPKSQRNKVHPYRIPTLSAWSVGIRTPESLQPELKRSVELFLLHKHSPSSQKLTAS